LFKIRGKYKVEHRIKIAAAELKKKKKMDASFVGASVCVCVCVLNELSTFKIILKKYTQQ